MIETFVLRAELSSPHDEGAEMRKLQAEALAAVERDKATTGKGRKGGLFQGLFNARPKVIKYGVRDDTDGILRCPDCIWEVVAGICENCGYRVRDEEDDGDMWSDMDDDDEDGLDDDDDSDESSSSDGSQLILDGAHFQFGRFVDELERRERIGRTNNTIPIEDDRASSVPTHDDDDDDDDDDYDDEDEESVRGPARRSQERNNGNSGRAAYELRVQISGNNRAMPGPANGPIIDLSEEAARDRIREAHHNRHARQASFDSEEATEDEYDEDDSLDGFIENDEDSPQISRRNIRGRSVSTADTSTSIATASSDLSSPPQTNTGPGRWARRVVMYEEDEDDAEDRSSVSEVSPRPQNYNAGRSYMRRRGPLALSSDEEDEDEDQEEDEDSLLGYTPLDHDTENDDYEDMPGEDSVVDGGFSPLASPIANRASSRGVTFAVREDNNEGRRDNEGDVDMTESSGGTATGAVSSSLAGNRRRRDSTPTTSSMSRRTRRSIRSSSEVTNTDTDDDDDDEPATRRARRGGVGGSERNHSGSHHASSSGNFLRNSRHNNHSNNNNHINSSHHRARQTNNPFNRREIIPGISQMLRRHVQQRTENQFEHLARLSSSPARSITPVPTSSTATVSATDGNNSLGGGGNNGRGGVGLGSFDALSSEPSQQQQQMGREASVESTSTMVGESGGRGSGGSTPVLITPRVGGAGSRGGHVSQYSSSSPCPSNAISEIASLVSNPRNTPEEGRPADVDGPGQSQRTRTAVPVVTPPPPRTSVPRREQTSTTTNTTSNNIPINTALTHNAPSSPPAVVPPQLLHHHRDHHRAPTTLPPPVNLSPAAHRAPTTLPPPVNLSPAAHRRIGHRGSRAGLRETGSRPNLRATASRNALRSTTPRPSSPGALQSPQVNIGSLLNPNRTTGGGASSNAGGTNGNSTGTSLIEESLAAGAGTRIPAIARVPRYTREEISRMGENMINRRRAELIQAQQNMIQQEGRSVGTGPGVGTLLGRGLGSLTRPLASSHLRTLSGGNESPSATVVAPPIMRRGNRRDVGAVVGGSGTSSNSSSGGTLGVEGGGSGCGGSAGGSGGPQLQPGFQESSPAATAPRASIVGLQMTESPLSSPVSAPLSTMSSPPMSPPQVFLRRETISGPASPYALGDSSSPSLSTGRNVGGGVGTSGVSGTNTGGVAPASPSGGSGSAIRRLGVGIGSGGAGGPIWVIRGATDAEPGDN